MVTFCRSADLPALTPESAPLMDQKETRYWAGVACLRRADPASALAHFERVLRLDPTYVPAAIAASTAALQLGRPAPALDFAQRALARPPASPAALFLAGVSAWWLGRGEEAGGYLERASALEPGNAEFRETLRRFRSGTLSR
jgi:tetratricopeptide (TPR) repeat protein